MPRAELLAARLNFLVIATFADAITLFKRIESRFELSHGTRARTHFGLNPRQLRLFLIDPYSNTHTTFPTSGIDYPTPTRSFHASAETMGTKTTNSMGLICSFHNDPPKRKKDRFEAKSST